MDSRRAETSDRLFDGLAVPAVFAVAYLAIGVGLAYSLIADSTELFIVVSGGTLVVILASLGYLFQREGIVTAENKLLGGFVLLAMAVFGGLAAFTNLSADVVVAIVFVIGVVVPSLLLHYTEYRKDE